MALIVIVWESAQHWFRLNISKQLLGLRGDTLFTETWKSKGLNLTVLYAHMELTEFKISKSFCCFEKGSVIYENEQYTKLSLNIK